MASGPGTLGQFKFSGTLANGPKERFVLKHDKFICRDMIRRTATRLLEIKKLWEGKET